MANKYRRIYLAILFVFICFLPLFLSPTFVLAIDEPSQSIEKKTVDNSDEKETSDNLGQESHSAELTQESSNQEAPKKSSEKLDGNIVGPQLEKSPKVAAGAIRNVKVTLPFTTRFAVRFVYPDGTPLSSSDLSIESRVVRQHYYAIGEQWGYNRSSVEILKNTFNIPYKGNGIWEDNYTTSPITWGVESDGLTENGYGVSYDTVFIEPRASVKSLNLIGGKGTYKEWHMKNTTSQLPSQPSEEQVFLFSSFTSKVTRTDSNSPSPYNTRYGFMRKKFDYNGLNWAYHPEYLWEDSIAIGAAARHTVSMWNTDGSKHLFYSERTSKYQNDYQTYEVEVPQIKETFIDQNHNEITSADLDNSLVQNNQYYAIQDNYTFGGHGQPSSLPLTYTKNGKNYEYKGWFLGDDFKTGVPQFDWKDIPDDQKDKYGKIRIMYAEKKNQYKLTGHWVDDSGDYNHLTNISGTISQNPGSMTVSEGYNFSGNAHTSIQENGNGPFWDFIGWEDPIHAPGVVNPGNPVVLNNVDCDTDFYYIYRKRIPRVSLELTPSSTVETESGKTIDWTLTINNTGGETLKNIKLLDSFVAASGGNMTSPVNTVVKNHSGTPISGITDASWTDNGAEFAAKNISVLKEQKLTINFQTTVTGDIHESIDHKVQVDGNIDSPESVTSNIRIKDSDHHAIKDPADGELSLLYAPNKFDFGFNKKENNGVVQTVNLRQDQYNSKTINKGFYVKLQDPRDNLAGNTWKLTASLDYFVDSSYFVLSTQPTIDLGNFSAETVTDANTGTESFSSTSNVTVTPGTISLVGGGGTIPVMNSQNLKNKGTWLLRIPFNDVKLHIPADIGEEGKGYTSELTWTLNDTI